MLSIMSSRKQFVFRDLDSTLTISDQRSNTYLSLSPCQGQEFLLSRQPEVLAVSSSVHDLSSCSNTGPSPVVPAWTHQFLLQHRASNVNICISLQTYLASLSAEPDAWTDSSWLSYSVSWCISTCIFLSYSCCCWVSRLSVSMPTRCSTPSISCSWPCSSSSCTCRHQIHPFVKSFQIRISKVCYNPG